MKYARLSLTLTALLLSSIREIVFANGLIKPEKYSIKFDLSENRDCPGKNCAYAVEVNITILVAARIKSVLLQCAHDLKVDESRTRLRKRYRNDTFEEVEIYRHVYKRGKFVSTVEIEAQLFETRRASRYVLTLCCDKNVRKNVQNINVSSYDMDQRIFVSTFNAPRNVPEIFPCLDDPMWASTFDLEIIHPSSYRAVAGTILSKLEVLNNETSRSTFKRTEKIPAYYLFFAVWNYEVDTSGSFYNLWRRSEVPATNLKLFIDYARKSFEYMLNVTANQDPIIPKMNLVAYSGLDIIGWYSSVSATLLRENIVNFHEEESTTLDRLLMLSNTVQAVVNQWIGVLIHPTSWNHFWLYKALASYIADLIVDKMEPTWRFCDQRFAENILWSMIDGEYPSFPAMRLFLFDVWNNKEYLWTDHLIVQRAILVIRLFHELHGYAEIDLMLKKFVKFWIDKKYGSSPLELVNSYENPYASAAVKDWLRNPGTPILHVSVDAITLEIELIQERFYAMGPWSKLPHHWLIPIRCYEIKSGRYRHEWVFPNITRTKPPAWMKMCLMNGTSSALFRVNYPIEWWMEISDRLSESPSSINEMQRMRLIDDAFALVLAGYREPEIFFNLTHYLVHDIDYFPWLAAAKTFKKLRSILKFGDNEKAKENLRLYVLNLLSKVYEHVGMEPVEGENYVTKLHRKNIVDLACSFGHEKCLEVAKEKLHCVLDAMENSATSWIRCVADSDIREIVFCQGIRRASSYTWNRMYDLLSVKHLFHATMSMIKRSLGCTEDLKILRAYKNSLSVISLRLELCGVFVHIKFIDVLQIFLIAAHINEGNARIVLENVVTHYQLLRKRSHFPGMLDRNIQAIAKEVYTYKIIHHIFLPFLWRNARSLDVSLMYNMKDQATANIILTKEARPILEKYIDGLTFL